MQIVINISVKGNKTMIEPRIRGASNDSVREMNVGQALLTFLEGVLAQVREDASVHSDRDKVVFRTGVR